MFSETGLNITFTFSLVPRGWLATGEKNTPNPISPALTASHLPQPLLPPPFHITPSEQAPGTNLAPKTQSGSKQMKGLPGEAPGPAQRLEQLCGRRARALRAKSHSGAASPAPPTSRPT